MIREDAYVGSIMIVVATIPPSQDTMFYLGAILAASLGIVLRVGVQVKNKNFTWRGFGVQMLITFPLCYFAYNVWLQYQMSLQIQTYLFLVSFMALFIVHVIERVSKIGILEAAQHFLNKIKAATPGEEVEEES